MCVLQTVPSCSQGTNLGGGTHRPIWPQVWKMLADNVLAEISVVLKSICHTSCYWSCWVSKYQIILIEYLLLWSMDHFSLSYRYVWSCINPLVVSKLAMIRHVFCKIEEQIKLQGSHFLTNVNKEITNQVTSHQKCLFLRYLIQILADLLRSIDE